jgi:hypothetical protein
MGKSFPQSPGKAMQGTFDQLLKKLKNDKDLAGYVNSEKTLRQIVLEGLAGHLEYDLPSA